jgi:hypothetical protein
MSQPQSSLQELQPPQEQSLQPSQDISGNPLKPAQVRSKKPNNGWTREQEELVAQWSDIAACYRWLHMKTESQYARNNMFISIPVIILSTLTGTVNVGLGSIVGDNKEHQKYANLGVGGVSILAGILSTLGNFFKFAQLSEANKSAALAWGKFQRLVAIELALHPNDRIDSMDFIKMCRNELDRLIEQSPHVPEAIIARFERTFGSIEQLKKPDICNHLEHTPIHKSKNERLKELAVEATLMMRSRRGLAGDAADVDAEDDAAAADIRRQISEKLRSKEEDTIISVIEEMGEAPIRAVMSAEDGNSAHLKLKM